VVVTLDGDGQHDPNDIPRLVFEIAQGHADVVVGSRYCLNRRRLRDDSETVPMHRSLGIRLITWLYNVGMGSKISDSQCCFRAFRGEVLRNLEIVESGFGFSTEMLMKIRKAGYRIAEVPVRCTYHKDYGKNSTLPPVRHFLEVLWRTLYWRLRFVIEEIKDA
jgi:glycosyltransferase involved in cell wall biosynthesis